jgi:hypothetical protein
MAVYEPSAHFLGLEVGQVGTVRDGATGRRWPGDFYIEATCLTNTDPPGELIDVASVARRFIRIPGPRSEDLPPFLPPESLGLDEMRWDQPARRALNIPASWFIPADPLRSIEWLLEESKRLLERWEARRP